MEKSKLFDFHTPISGLEIPSRMNNPFSSSLPEIACIAASEFQQFIAQEAKNWADFKTQRGKMYGVLVVECPDKKLRYLGTVSGKLPGKDDCERFIPSIVDQSSEEFFLNKGMLELSAMSEQIDQTDDQEEQFKLKKERKKRSIALQQEIFEYYDFVNLSGEKRSLIEIFLRAENKMPPSGAGECAAPKLLQFALKNELKPIAIAEFWWGNDKGERQHGEFYPACTKKCKPILGFILEDEGLIKKEH